MPLSDWFSPTTFKLISVDPTQKRAIVRAIVGRAANDGPMAIFDEIASAPATGADGIGITVMPLKDLEIRARKAQERVYKRADERGLYLEVPASSLKLWRLKYAHLGKDKRIALRRYLKVGLAETRRERDEARQKLRDGVDSFPERKREKFVALFNAANTFGDVARRLVASLRWIAMSAPVSSWKSRLPFTRANRCFRCSPSGMRTSMRWRPSPVGMWPRTNGSIR